MNKLKNHYDSHFRMGNYTSITRHDEFCNCEICGILLRPRPDDNNYHLKIKTCPKSWNIIVERSGKKHWTYCSTCLAYCRKRNPLIYQLIPCYNPH